MPASIYESVSGSEFVGHSGDLPTVLSRAMEAKSAGHLEKAILLFANVINLWPSHDQARYALACCFLDLKRFAAALSCFLKLEAECGTVSDSRYLIATILASEGDSSGAKVWLDKALSGAIQPYETRMLPFGYLTPARLIHDVLQLEHLINKSKVNLDFFKELKILKTVFEESFGQSFENWAECKPEVAIKLEISKIASLYRVYRKVVYISECDPPGHVLNQNLQWLDFQNSFLTSDPRVRHVVVDDFLSATALSKIQDFLANSWIWFNDAQKGYAYVGTHKHNGLACPAIARLAEELKIALPELLINKKLSQYWAYRNVLGSNALGIHADSAEINVNLWLTPDQYNCDRSRGGLKLFSKSRSVTDTFENYNDNDEAIIAAVSDAYEVDVPYKCNRAVIFDSSLYHGSDEPKFLNEYSGLRTNLTLLFV